MFSALLLSWMVCTEASAGSPVSIPVTRNTTSPWTSVTRHLDQLTIPLVLPLPHQATTTTNSTIPDLIYVLDTSGGLRLEPSGCNLALKALYPRRSPRQAVQLRDGLLAIWLRSEDYDGHRRHWGEWRLVLVDFSRTFGAGVQNASRACARIVAELRLDDGVDVVDVLPGRQGEGFDLVLGERGDDEVKTGVVSVLRYDDQAQLRGQLQLFGMDFYPLYTPKTVHLHPIGQSNPESGYFLVQIIPQARVSIVKRLNSKFEPIKSRTLKHSRHTEHNFDAYSTDHGNFTICRFNGDSRRSFHCLMLDSMLGKRSKVNLKHIELASSPYTIAHLQVKNTPTGGVLIAFSVVVDGRSSSSIHAQLVDNNGKSSEVDVIGLVECFIYEISIVHTKDLKYCVNVICDEIVHTKCFEIEEIVS